MSKRPRPSDVSDHSDAARPPMKRAGGLPSRKSYLPTVAEQEAAPRAAARFRITMPYPRLGGDGGAGGSNTVTLRMVRPYTFTFPVYAKQVRALKGESW